MATAPLSQVQPGVATTTSINNIIQYVNATLAGLAQTQSAAATVTLNPIPGPQTDITGATLAVVTTGANAFVQVCGVFDIRTTAGSAGSLILGLLSVDGSIQAAQAVKDGTTTGTEQTVTQTWLVPLTAGTHTLKLRATASAGTHQANLTNTTITALVFDLP